jgi:hypothetical protein
MLYHIATFPLPSERIGGNRVTGSDWQFQLESFLNLGLFALSDVGSDGLRRSLYGFGGHFQAGQNFHRLATEIEVCLLTHHRLHAAYAGRDFRVLNIQFDIRRNLADAAVCA